MSVDQKVLEKIQKLLALTSSSNEHEARLAAERASELLTKYNLTASQLPSTDNEYQKTEVARKRRLSPEDRYITGILCEYFFVENLFDI